MIGRSVMQAAARRCLRVPSVVHQSRLTSATNAVACSLLPLRRSFCKSAMVTKKGEDGEEMLVPLNRSDYIQKPAEDRIHEFPHLYSSTNRLIAQTDADVGKFVEVIVEEMALVPAVLQDKLEDPLLMGGSYFMVRQTMVDLITALTEIHHNTEDNAAGSSVAVHGPRGSGKTVLLNALSLFAIQNDWLLLGHTGQEFLRDMHGFITPSDSRPGTFNQNRNAVAFFTNLMDNQGNRLKRITLKREYSYTWSQVTKDNKTFSEEGEVFPAPTTLYGLFEQACLQPSIATDVFYDMVAELQDNTEVPVLVLMDNLNAWDHMSLFRRPENAFKKIGGRELGMVDAFSKFQDKGPGNGMSVMAMTSHATQNMGKAHMERATFTMEQTIYNDNELQNCAHHYKVSGLFTSRVDSFMLARMKGLTGGVPRDLFFDAALL